MAAGVTSDYHYDRDAALISQTIAASTTAFAYDAFGNMTAAATESGTQTLYGYDAAERLTSITPPGQSATTLTHDALGRIASRGAQTYSYVGTTNTVWRSSDASGATLSAIDASGGRASVARGSDFGWLLPDLHGNQALARNQAETAIVSATRYDGYGQDLASYAAGTLPTPWRYQGRLDLSPDTDNPLYDAGARLYSPAIGAFTQLDSFAGSVQDPLSLNRYLYGEANPTSLIDPDGHMALQTAGAGGLRLPAPPATPWDHGASSQKASPPSSGAPPTPEPAPVPCPLGECVSAPVPAPGHPTPPTSSETARPTPTPPPTQTPEPSTPPNITLMVLSRSSSNADLLTRKVWKRFLLLLLRGPLAESQSSSRKPLQCQDPLLPSRPHWPPTTSNTHANRY